MDIVSSLPASSFPGLFHDLLYIKKKKKKKLTVTFPTLLGDDTLLYRQMIGSYSDSVAPGTLVNRFTQAKLYVTFSVYYGFDPLSPSSTDVCLYTQFLKNSFSAPTTIKNYLSGVKTWLGEHGGDLSSFSSFEFHQLSSGLAKRSRHVPQRAAPLTWAHLRIIANFLDTTPGVPLSAKPCLLIGFHTFLRAGNLLSPTISSWGGAHTIRTKDISLSDEGIHISVCSTKTKTDPSAVTTVIPWLSDHLFCPATSWFKYQQRVKPWTLGPAFLTDAGLPLTARHLVGFMRLALKDVKDIDPARVSMHSLRRGAAQAAALDGLSIASIKERGMWKSDSGVAPYLL